MASDLGVLEKTLIDGQRLARQGSYERRAPAKKAVPFLLAARAGLREFVEDQPNDSRAWQLLSMAEEYLLNYAAALPALERSMALSGKREPKTLKRLILLKEAAQDWQGLTLAPDQLEDLGEFLTARLEETGCDHSLRHTLDWNAERGGRSKVLADALRNRGGYCDCEVLANVVQG